MWSIWDVIPILVDGAAIIWMLQFIYASKIAKKKNIVLGIALYIAVEISLLINGIDIEIISWITILLIICISMIIRNGAFSSRLLAAVITILIIFTLRHCFRYGCAILFNQRWMGKSSHYVVLSLNRTGRSLYYFLTSICEILICWLLYRKRNDKVSFSRREEWILSAVILVVVALATRLFFGLYRSFSLELLEICLITAILFLLIFAFASLILTKTMITQKIDQYNHEKIKLENQVLSSSYEQIVLRNEALLKQRHNFAKHLNVIRNLRFDEAGTYIDDLLKNTREPLIKSYSGDPYVDAVLNSKIEEIEEKKIDFQFAVDIPKPIDLSTSDICSILYNLIENAIEACEKIKEPEQRSIDLSISHKGQFIAFVCRNSILPQSVHHEDLYHSTKKASGHGFGIMSMKDSAERNGGSITFDIEENYLTVKVILNTE